MESTSSPKTGFSRQEHINHLPDFLRGVVASAGAAQNEKVRGALADALSAECVGCGVGLSGAELLELVEGSGDNPKLKRLRMGDCARQSCSSFFYVVRGAEHPELNWPSILGEEQKASAEQQEAQAQVQRSAVRTRKGQVVKRVAIGVAIVVVLLMIRQWYVGGRIPLIREPEQFQVDRLPPG